MDLHTKVIEESDRRISTICFFQILEALVFLIIIFVKFALSVSSIYKIVFIIFGFYFLHLFDLQHHKIFGRNFILSNSSQSSNWTSWYIGCRIDDKGFTIKLFTINFRPASSIKYYIFSYTILHFLRYILPAVLPFCNPKICDLLRTCGDNVQSLRLTEIERGNIKCYQNMF